MNDMELRNFYEVKDPDYVAYIPEHIKSKFSKSPNIYEIIDRILLPENKINHLKDFMFYKDRDKRDEMIRDT